MAEWRDGRQKHLAQKEDIMGWRAGRTKYSKTQAWVVTYTPELQEVRVFNQKGVVTFEDDSVSWDKGDFEELAMEFSGAPKDIKYEGGGNSGNYEEWSVVVRINPTDALMDELD